MKFDAYTSDWLHERKWRIPIRPEFSGLQITSDVIGSVIIGEPTWKLWRQVLEPTDYLIGMDGTPGLDGVCPGGGAALAVARVVGADPRVLLGPYESPVRPRSRSGAELRPHNLRQLPRGDGTEPRRDIHAEPNAGGDPD